MAYCTVSGDGDEIAVYEGCGGRDDRDPLVLAEAARVMVAPASHGEATTYST